MTHLYDQNRKHIGRRQNARSNIVVRFCCQSFQKLENKNSADILESNGRAAAEEYIKLHDVLCPEVSECSNIYDIFICFAELESRFLSRGTNPNNRRNIKCLLHLRCFY
jgi:hypothetical protein